MQGCIGRHVQDYPAMIALHGFNAGSHAVENASHIYLVNPVEVFLRGVLQLAHVRDSGAVYQDVNRPFCSDVMEHALYVLPIGDVTVVGFGFSASVANACHYRFSLAFIQIKDMHAGAVRGKHLRNRLPNAACTARNHRHGTIQPEHPVTTILHHQRETPLFHGIKSSCASSSALVLTSPLATLITSSQMSSPISSPVFFPEIMGPASRSIMSDMRCASSEFVAIFTTGAIGLPVGVPNP